jgi:hypothetical protein
LIRSGVADGKIERNVARIQNKEFTRLNHPIAIASRDLRLMNEGAVIRGLERRSRQMNLRGKSAEVRGEINEPFEDAIARAAVVVQS